MFRKDCIFGAALAAALGCGGLSPAWAEVIVSGAGDSIELSAGDATVEEALTALGAKFQVRYHSSEPLTRRLSGTYRGTLEGVVSQALADYSFTIMNKGDGVEVWAMGANEAARSPVRPAPIPSRPAPVEESPDNQAPSVPLPASTAPIIPASSPELTKAFGRDAPPIQMSEDFVNAYVHRANRGNTRRNPAAQ